MCRFFQILAAQLAVQLNFAVVFVLVLGHKNTRF
jgi:hypothetical protein